MITINTTEIIKNFDGDAMKNGEKDATLGWFLSNCILVNKEDPLRSYILGQEIYKAEGEYTIKDSDVSFIEKGIKDSTFPTIVKGQLLLLLGNKS